MDWLPKQCSKHKWAPKTYQSNLALIQNLIIPYIGEMQMQKLRPYHIEALYDTLSKTPCRKEQQHEGATAHLPTVWASIRRAARAVASGQPDGHLPEVRHDGGTGGHAEAGNATGADAAGRVRHGQPLGD